MRLLRPLRDTPIALLWAGLATSAVGDQLYTVVLSWIAVAVFGPAAGYLGALSAAMVLLTALGCGAWADRQPNRAMMIAADGACAGVLLLVMTVWLATGKPPAWGLVLAVGVIAAGQAFFRPALQASLPGLIPDRTLLPATNALLDTTGRIARLLGPGLVSLLAVWLPLVHFLALDAATFIVSAACILVIGRLRAMPHTPPADWESMAASVARGFRATREHAVLGFVLGSTFVINGAWYTAMFLGLPLAIDRLGITGPGGGGLSAYGLVISAYGCTNLLATLVVGNLALPVHPGRRVFSGGVTTGTGIALLGIAMAMPLPSEARLPCFMAAAGLAAIGGPMSDVTIATLRQLLLAMTDIAAAMRAYMVMTNAGALLGMLLAPALIRTIGPPAMVLLCGLAIALTGAIGLLRHRDVRLAVA